MGVYSQVAVPLKGGPWREASMALLAREICAKMSGRKQCFRWLSSCDTIARARWAFAAAFRVDDSTATPTDTGNVQLLKGASGLIAEPPSDFQQSVRSRREDSSMASSDAESMHDRL